MTTHPPIFVVTSMAAAHWTIHGRRMVESVLAHWPEGTAILAYIDGGATEDPEPMPTRDGVTLSIFPTEGIPNLSRYLAAVTAFPTLCGEANPQAYDYRVDARFGRKAFVQEAAGVEALRRTADGPMAPLLFWVDADTVTHSDVTPDFLDECLPAGKIGCYLGRDQIGMHSEAGFVGWNLGHRHALSLLAVARAMYQTGRVFLFPEWHDCYVNDVVRTSAIADDTWPEVSDEAFVDLGAGVPLDAQHIHVFINSRLGAVMDHMKGPNRKKWGASPAADLTVARNESYWTGEG